MIKDKKIAYGNLAETIIGRIKQAEGLRFDSDVAALLAVDRRNLHGWKSRGAIPMEYLVTYTRESGVSLDWLIHGKGAPRMEAVAEPPPPPGAIDPARLERIMDAVDGAARAQGLGLDNSQRARLCSYLYDPAKEDADLATEVQRLFTLLGLV